MSTIADSIIARRGSRANNKTKDVRIGGMIRERHDVFIKLKKPPNYPKDKYLINSLHGIKLSNTDNFTKIGAGSESRFMAIIRGNGENYYYNNNFFDLLKWYPEYPWMDIVNTYPRNVSSYYDVTLLLREMQDVSQGSIIEYENKLYICGAQPQNEEIGKIYELFNFDCINYLNNKNVASATVAAPPMTFETLKCDIILKGNENNFDLKLENICLQRSLRQSQKLNTVLSSKVNDGTRDGLSMIDQQIGRRVNERGSKKPAKGECYFPRATVFGPSGVIRMIQDLAGKQWTIDENNSKKTYEMTLDNTEYIQIFGASNAIKNKKNGRFYISKLDLSILINKKVAASKIKLKYNCIVNGQLNNVDGSFTWLRTGQ